jgi:hypothetical protein
VISKNNEAEYRRNSSYFGIQKLACQVLRSLRFKHIKKPSTLYVLGLFVNIIEYSRKLNKRVDCNTFKKSQILFIQRNIFIFLSLEVEINCLILNFYLAKIFLQKDNLVLKQN